ncbi:hypothetical protein D3C87_1188670 [compost metagenome]
MAQLQGDLRIAVRMHEIDDAAPCLRVRFAVHAGTGGRDARIGRHARHLGKHEARATHGARAQVHQMVVARHAIDGAVLRHRRDGDAVFQQHAAQAERREHGRQWLLRQRHASLLARAPRQPLFITGHVGRVAQAQVFMRNALAAREHRIGELRRFHDAVTLDVFKPLHGIARRALDFQHLDGAQLLVGGQRRSRLGMLAEAARQLDRVFQRQLGTGAYRIMGRVGRVAHQHDGHAILVMHPLPANDAGEGDPLRRAAQMRRIAQQTVAVEFLGE